MNFIALPPEVTSTLIHSGPGAESLLEASTAWQRLGIDVEETVRAYVPAVARAAEAWHGPSSSVMIDAVTPYLGWMRTTAQQCQQLSSSAQLAAAAFGATLSAVVHPSDVNANRNQLATLLATNGFGRNLAAIAETEAQYDTMWVNNSAAMYRYEATSAQALTLPKFASPPSIVNPVGLAAQANVAPAAAATTAPAAAVSPVDAVLQALGVTFDPNSGWFGLANTYANQFISSGFPINLFSYLAQNTSAQALQAVAPDIAAGLSEGEAALGESAASLSGAVRALGAAEAPTAAVGVGVSLGRLTAPPAVVGLLPAPTPVQLASAVSPLPSGESGFPMLPPLMAPPISAGSGWRKRKQVKYEDLEYGLELKGTIMPRPPSAG
ncbi:PPE family protein [Mycobacterium simiae]|uniref:PPE family protein n=1 Tax=Mycobacterium simiae TaxID=1784 RepID=A0A5B1BLU3_MYCSI|nr:PPE family protein [Mycobacterium simiae]KAA1249597.1 PPE family protein [Mycobacterium simiae]